MVFYLKINKYRSWSFRNISHWINSIHCDLKPNEIKGIKVDDNNFNCWKLESSWDNAKFVRQKTYIEHITHENLQKIAQLTKKAADSIINRDEYSLLTAFSSDVIPLANDILEKLNISLFLKK